MWKGKVSISNIFRLGKHVFLLAQAQPGDPPERGQVHDAIAVSPTGGVAEHLAGQLARFSPFLPRVTTTKRLGMSVLVLVFGLVCRIIEFFYRGEGQGD